MLPLCWHNTRVALYCVSDGVRNGVRKPHGMQPRILCGIQVKGIATLQSLVCFTILVQVWGAHKATWVGKFLV